MPTATAKLSGAQAAALQASNDASSEHTMRSADAFVDAPELDPSRGSRDVLSGGLYFAAVDWLRFGSIYEVRWDRDLPTGAFREVLQAVTRNTVDIHIDSVTIFALFIVGASLHLLGAAR